MSSVFGDSWDDRVGGGFAIALLVELIISLGMLYSGNILEIDKFISSLKSSWVRLLCIVPFYSFVGLPSPNLKGTILVCFCYAYPFLLTLSLVLMTGVLALGSPRIMLESLGIATYGLILRGWLIMLIGTLFSFMKFAFFGCWIMIAAGAWTALGCSLWYKLGDPS